MQVPHPPGADIEILRKRAIALGVELTYTDLDGVTREASESSLAAVVTAFGDAPSAARIEPVHVVWFGEPAKLRAGRSIAGVAPGELRLEDGEASQLTLHFAAGAAELVGASELPLGCHELHLELPGEVGEAATLLIVAPRRVHAGPAAGRRSWGVFVPVYALRSEPAHDLGVGDLRDLDALLGVVEQLGGTYVGSTPMLAAFLDEPFEPSPYAPVSRQFWNELFVDVTALPELDGSTIEVEGLPEGELIDYREAASVKRQVLEYALGELAGPRRDAFEAWRAANPAVDDYARFRAAVEQRGASWQAWPAGPARDGTLAPDDYEPGVAEYHAFAQWVTETQLAALRDGHTAGLYLDLPVGVHPDGYDTWRERGLFVPGMSVGAPPDPLGPLGQDWGLPPLHPERIRTDGYRYVRAYLQHLFRHAAAVRIDHVMGLDRLFWIPHGRPASEGVYVRYPAEELWALVCLESHRAGALVVGEDLGTVPAVTRVRMDAHEARRSYVLQFALHPEEQPAIEPPPANALASINTHDTPTFAGFWAGQSAAARASVVAELQRGGELPRSSGGGGPDTWDVLGALLERLGSSDADVVIASLEDLWLEPDPQNIPGTGAEHPNWRRRCTRSVGDVAADVSLRALLERLAAARISGHPPEPVKEPAMPATHTPSLLGDQDLHFFNEGTHAQLHTKLGAHLTTVDGVAGTLFAVWAPNAAAVSVVGDFNQWQGGKHPLSPRGRSGIWEGFVPEIGHGEIYKYRIKSRWGGYGVDKADPFAVHAELSPRTGSIVWDPAYEWDDAEWMSVRGRHNALDAPMSVYELHLGSWRRDPDDPRRLLSYRELAQPLVEHLTATGFTHVELLPVMEHPFYGSWGYQTTGYFAPSSRFGTPQDFKYLVDQLHRAGIGVILDWVPSHFPSDEHGLAYFDGTHLFEHSDPRQGFHPDWKSCIFNYGRAEVRSFLLSSARVWLDDYHIDGLRVDAVASMLYLDYSREEGEWIPNEHGGRENLEAISFLQQLNRDAYGAHPDIIMIAEESTAWGGVSRPVETGGLGFGLKWDMGWMHDSLEYFRREAIHRGHHQDELTFRAIYAFTENFMLPLSHDEVVHGKGSLLDRMPGDDWQRFANLRLLLAYQWLQPGKKLLFMGCEFAHGTEWDHEKSLDWHLLDAPRHAGVQQLVGDLNRVYRERSELHELDVDPAGFQWVDTSDAESSVMSWLRLDSEGNTALCIFNATPVAREHYRIGVPVRGFWRELINTDAEAYGGSGVGNLGGVETAPIPLHGREWSVSVTLPPLGMLLLVPDPEAGSAQ